MRSSLPFLQTLSLYRVVQYYSVYYFYVKVTFVLVRNGAKNNRLIGHTYNDDKTLNTQTAHQHMHFRDKNAWQRVLVRCSEKRKGECT